MAEIKWWVWLGIGLVVTVTSAVIGGALWLFMWVGLLFVIVGAGKLVFKVVFAPKETRADKQAMQMPQAHQQPQAYYCPRCRITVQPSDYFCRYCGSRLR